MCLFRKVESSPSRSAKVDRVLSMGALVCITCIRLCFYQSYRHDMFRGNFSLSFQICSLFCLVQWVCYVKLLSVHIASVTLDSHMKLDS